VQIWTRRTFWRAGLALAAVVLAGASLAQEAPRAFIDGTGPEWRTLGEGDFADVNGSPDTWTWKDGVLRCS